MSNSIAENENSFTPSFCFDDASSTLSSDREDFLLVLVSSLSKNKHQKRALTIIEACGVHPEVLDAADPANAIVRDELCEMSGIKGIFPQFFLVQGDRTSFFADYNEIEHMNEEGTLAEWLSMELPIAKDKCKLKEELDSNKTATATNDKLGHISKSYSTQVDIHVNAAQSDHDYAQSSTTEDLLNMANNVSKILNSFDKNGPDEDQEEKDENKTENDNRNMILSIPAVQDEWSDPTLLERYEGEIQALDDYLQDEGALPVENRPRKEETLQQKFPKKSDSGNVKSTAQMFEAKNKTLKLHQRTKVGAKKKMNLESKIESKTCQDGNACQSTSSLSSTTTTATIKHNSISSLSSTATTATITPTSSRSRSPEMQRSHPKSTVDVIPSTLPSPPRNKNNEKEFSCMDTVSTRSETEQLLQAEVEELRLRCEKLTAERYIMEGQLKEARQRNHVHDQRAQTNAGTIHKFQLLQATRCVSCSRAFKSSPSSPNVPISSHSCGHSICRNCCHKRLSAARRYQTTINSSERLRNTISSDLFMCGMGDMSHVYSQEVQQRQMQECESCPICSAPRAFRPGKLNINEGICAVLKLLED